MYLRLRNFKGGLRDQVSIKSSEESVSNLYHVLKPILEEEYISNTTSSMSLDTRNIDLPELSMAFNMRLTYVKTNDHGAQLFQDPMNHWVVQVKDTPTTFDAAPWVNYQGDLYMGQSGERYIVVTELENIDKWGGMVKVDKVEDPPFGDSTDMKLLNTIKVHLIKMNDPNIAMYVQEFDEVKTCYLTKTLDLGTIHEEKLLYIYLEGTNTLKLNLVFLDKFRVLYESMEQRVVRSLSLQGLPILELAPKPTSSIGTRIFSPKGGDSRNVASMQRSPNLAEDALSS